MNKTLYILLTIFVLMTGCSEDDPVVQQDNRMKLRVPIEWMPDGGGMAARVGDPGVDDALPAPSNVYVFSYIKKSDDAYEYIFAKKEGLTADDWVQQDSGTLQSRYCLKNDFELALNVPDPKTCTDGDELGRTYAIASNRTLSEAELKAIVGTDYEAILSSDESVEFDAVKGAAIDAQLENAEFSTDGWTSPEFRDLYSTPFNDATFDTDSIKNGRIMYLPGLYIISDFVQGAVRLYHTAARIDFQWEVAEALWGTTAIKSITVNNLPTMCKVFKPVQNTATGEAGNPARPYTIDKDNTVNPINPGNKWIGRQCFYALQPSDATINYTVTFEDVNTTDGEPVRSPKTLTFTPPSPLHSVYTGWYRILATVE